MINNKVGKTPGQYIEALADALIQLCEAPLQSLAKPLLCTLGTSLSVNQHICWEDIHHGILGVHFVGEILPRIITVSQRGFPVNMFSGVA